MSDRRRRIIEDQVQALLNSDPGLMVSANWPLPAPNDGVAQPMAPTYRVGAIDWLAAEPRYPRIRACFMDTELADPRSSRVYRAARQLLATAIHVRVRLRTVFGSDIGGWPVHAWLFVHPSMSRPLRAALELAGLPARITPLDRTDPWFETGWGNPDPRTSWDPDPPLIPAPTPEHFHPSTETLHLTE